MTMRRALVGISAVVLATIAGAQPANAGAPNYECRAGPYSIGIDQHRRAGLARFSGGAVQSASFVTTDQNGLSVRGGRKSGGQQRLGMGTAAGLDGASTIVEGWGRLTDVSMLGPPGP